MAISKVAAFRGISDCKIAAVSSDTASGITYGSLIDVPIQGLTVTENRDNYDLKHDDQLQAVVSKLQSCDISGTMAQISLDALNVLAAGTITASGSGTAEKQTYLVDAANVPGYFKLEIVSAQTHSDAADIGDIHVQYKKCKIQTLEYTFEDGFATVKFTAKAIKTIFDSDIKSIVLNETAAVIA